MKRIGLCMIVKNESKVILRCLESVRPIIDYVLIEDTGSTDQTQSIIRAWLKREGLPGEVYDEPWRDFAYNRSHALSRLRENDAIDYAFVMDADDSLSIDPQFDVAAFKNGLNRDLYDVPIVQGGVRYWRPQICSNTLEFRYRGVLHEYMEAPSNSFSRGTALGLTILSTREGARSQDPRKYQKDAAILETALGSEQDPFLRSRYAFYLARSYRDCGENERALPYFLMRAELGYWTEEIFMSLYGAGQVQEQLEHPVDEVIGTYLRASETSPTRAEALHAASRLCRVKGRFHEAYRYARQGLAIPQPEGGLFVESWIYDYGLLDEFAVSAYWVGAFRDSFDASLKLLGGGKLPPSMVQRVATNAQFAADRILSPSSPIVNHERPVRHARDYADIMDHLGAKCSPAFSVQVNEASRLLS